LANPGTLLVAASGSLFVAYVFNLRGVATWLDSYFGNLNQAAESHQEAVADVFLHALPAMSGVLVLILMLIFLRASGGKSAAKKPSAESRGVEGFVEAAAAEGISPRVARSAYRVLLPFVRKNRYLGIDDTLFHDLRLREDQLSDIYGSILRLSDRKRRVGDDGAGIRGVTGLLMAVEASEQKPDPATITGRISRNHIAASVAGAANGRPAERPGPVPVPDLKPKKPSAVLVHPARLPRRELSMIRSRPARRVEPRSAQSHSA
jgi:hypothetical protein